MSSVRMPSPSRNGYLLAKASVNSTLRVEEPSNDMPVWPRLKSPGPYSRDRLGKGLKLRIGERPREIGGVEHMAAPLTGSGDIRTYTTRG